MNVLECSNVQRLLQRPNTEWLAVADQTIAVQRQHKTKLWHRSVAPLWSNTPLAVPSRHGRHHIPIELHRWKQATGRWATALLVPVLWIHGGGMVFPSGQYGDPKLAILQPLGPELLIASVEYRLAPRHACPAAALDVIDALDWLHRNASALGADPSRLAIMGESAGGNLAAVAALHAAQQAVPPARFAAVFYPMIFNAVNTTSYTLFDKIGNPPKPGLSKCHMEFYWRAYCPATQICNDWRCLPLTGGLHRTYARSHPQTLVVSCSTDVLRDDGVQFHAALRKAGVEVEHLQVKGDHGCTHIRTSDPSPLLDRLRSGLRIV